MIRPSVIATTTLRRIGGSITNTSTSTSRIRISTNSRLIKSINHQCIVSLQQQQQQSVQHQQQPRFSTTTIGHMPMTTNPLLKYRSNNNNILTVNIINTTIGRKFATIPFPFEVPVSSQESANSIATSTESITATSGGNDHNNNKIKLPINIILYHYKICPFCTRVRVILDYLNVPYSAIDVNPLSKSEIKSFKEQYNYNKVPILILDNEPLFDSDTIIQKLLDNTFIQSKLQLRWDDSILEQNDDEQLIEYEEIIIEEEVVVPSVSSAEEEAVLASTNNDDQQQQQQETITTTTMTMDLFLDNLNNTDNNSTSTDEQDTTNTTTKDWSYFATNTVASLLYPNICRTISDSYDAFRYIHQINKYTIIQQYTIRCIGSIAMYFAASKVKKRLNITDERKALEDALLLFETEGLLKVSNTISSDDDTTTTTTDNEINFLSGSYYNPNIHDLTMYGVLHSIESLPIHTELILKQPNRPITKWYKRMKYIVSKLKNKDKKFIFKINE